MLALTHELDAIPPYSFELTVHNPAGWYWHNPLEVYSEDKIWTALHLSSEKLIGLRLESLGNIQKPKVSLRVFSHQKLKINYERTLIYGLPLYTATLYYFLV